jgi:hypothetical protein
MGMTAETFLQMIELHPKYANYVKTIETPCDLSGNLAKIIPLLNALKSLCFVPVRSPHAPTSLVISPFHLLAAFGASALSREKINSLVSDGPWFDNHGRRNYGSVDAYITTILGTFKPPPLPLEEVSLWEGALNSQAITRYKVKKASVLDWTAVIYQIAQFPSIKRITLDYDYSDRWTCTYGLLRPANRRIIASLKGGMGS